ncbi:MAG: hypothetical protein WHT07_05725 [Desulfobaccales bacterium]
MHLTCTFWEATFPGAPAALRGTPPLTVSLDCHDRPPYILRVAPLESTPMPAAADTDLIRFRLSLSPGREMQAALRNFAVLHSLPLTPPTTPEEVWEEPLLLAASHLAEGKMFIFSEKAVLRCRQSGPVEVECEVTGPFKARRLPCQETDVILHLEAPATARLLSWLLAVIG